MVRQRQRGAPPSQKVAPEISEGINTSIKNKLKVTGLPFCEHFHKRGHTNAYATQTIKRVLKKKSFAKKSSTDCLTKLQDVF